MIVIGGKAGVGGQMSDHTWCLGIRRVCGDRQAVLRGSLTVDA